MDPIVKYEPPQHIKQQILKEWIESNSKPRLIRNPPKIKRGPKFSNTARLEVLSKPLKVYVKPARDPTSWVYKLKHIVSKRAKNYTATERIITLAQPKSIYKKPKEKTIPKSTLEYEASQRIINLSKPPNPKKKWKQRKEKNVKPEALKYIASKRIIEIAQPRKREVPQKEFLFKINPKALKAATSKRIRKLSKSRQIFTAKELEEREMKRLKRKAAFDVKFKARMQKLREKFHSQSKNN